ncbi:MAG TPA: hypothetical protein VK464_12200 [Symbiobacteriaceae bacterium]|jgi:hypothetical protein|nr:hypothetical protein [Symbiobacteriaceae bacterium]
MRATAEICIGYNTAPSKDFRTRISNKTHWKGDETSLRSYAQRMRPADPDRAAMLLRDLVAVGITDRGSTIEVTCSEAYITVMVVNSSQQTDSLVQVLLDTQDIVRLFLKGSLKYTTILHFEVHIMGDGTRVLSLEKNEADSWSRFKAGLWYGLVALIPSVAQHLFDRNNSISLWIAGLSLIAVILIAAISAFTNRGVGEVDFYA